jgi:hypothetical protein
MMEDNDTVYIEPEHTIEMEDPAQFRELKIADNIQGAMSMYGVCRNLTQQIEAVFPTSMGDVGKASVTATAVAGADSRANIRANYRALTDEFTFNNEFYWMILQMAWQFMHKSTIEKVFKPDEIMAFKPAGDYTYQPVTSAIEAEYSKNKKIQMYDQLIGRMQGLVEANPQYLTVITYMIGEIMNLMGAEGQIVAPMLEELMKKNQKEPSKEGQGEQVKDGKDQAMSNQGQTPQTDQEQQARMLMAAGGMKKRAYGGPVNAGEPYLVNELGPEAIQTSQGTSMIPGGPQIMVPQQDGNILPNPQAMQQQLQQGQQGQQLGQDQLAFNTQGGMLRASDEVMESIIATMNKIYKEAPEKAGEYLNAATEYLRNMGTFNTQRQPPGQSNRQAMDEILRGIDK